MTIPAAFLRARRGHEHMSEYWRTASALQQELSMAVWKAWLDSPEMERWARTNPYHG